MAPRIPGNEKMQLSMLRAKLHQARVTGADINYVGSIPIDLNEGFQTVPKKSLVGVRTCQIDLR